ncbi:MAG: hypothetical protein ACRDI2_16755 [Chloroflexota bacterium]
MSLLRAICLAQGIYFALTGVWALVNIRTFEVVTGPKVDRWLVKTVGALVTVIGGVLISAGARGRVSPAGGVEVPLLAVGSAAALAGIDAVYVAKRRISPIYLLDAVAEVILIAGWAIGWRLGRRAG